MLVLIVVVLLTGFILVTTRSGAVYKRDPATNENKLSFRALVVVTAIITAIWYAVYMFLSKDTDNSSMDDDFGLD